MGCTPANEDDIQAKARAAWRVKGALLVRVDDIRDDWLRQALINLGNERYGRRSAAAK